MIFSGTMLVPLAVSLLVGEIAAARNAYAASITVTLGCGLLLWRLSRSQQRDLTPRDGILLVVLAWTVVPLFASMPLLLYFREAGSPISFTHAYFEAMSGLTTTGATVLTGLDSLPPSINMWRCLLQWMGGMGILVLAVAILPIVGAGGSQLFRAEAAGPIKDTKLTPRINETAKGLWTVYAGLSLACAVAYWVGGMSWLDAWMHMFTTMSLGGLSSHDASFGYFNSAVLDWICVVFMLIASCNFAMYFLALRKRSLWLFFCDTEVRGTLGLLVVASLMTAAFLLAKGTYDETAHALRMAFFNVVSIGSTTGYSTSDYTKWPVVVPILMLLLSGVATSAGSTGAGIKMSRVLILLKQAKREMQRIVHPRSVRPVQLNGRPISNETLLSVLAFMLVYGGTIIVLTLLLMASDLDFDTSFSAVVASINNMGPGLGKIGPAGNYEWLSDYQTWLCTAAMLLGRLEMFSVLVLFSRQYWRG